MKLVTLPDNFAVALDRIVCIQACEERTASGATFSDQTTISIDVGAGTVRNITAPVSYSSMLRMIREAESGE